jgi:hypothetical protein
MAVGNVLIMAGGTGGHVFPALACAREFQARGYTVHWLGTPRGIENELVPAAGLKLHLINVTGLRGKGRLSLLKAPFMLVKALLQARNVVRELSLRDRPRRSGGKTGGRATDHPRTKCRSGHGEPQPGFVRRAGLRSVSANLRRVVQAPYHG